MASRAAHIGKSQDDPTRFRRAGAAQPPAPVQATSRWYIKLLLLALGAAMLTLSFAPYKQFYLAPFGLAPWLIVINACRSRWQVLGWSWLAGTMFFAANMWWLVYVSGPGVIALVVILGLYWSAAGWLIRGAGLLPGPLGWGGPPARPHATATAAAGAGPIHFSPVAATAIAGAGPIHFSPVARFRPLLAIFGIATAWVAVAEWLRATWPFGGLSWLFLGYTQSPILHLCQVADLTGVYGLSFWVALTNGWVALFFLNRLGTRTLLPAAVAVVVVSIALLGYGFFRFGQETTYPGPAVMVVQSNYPQTNTGEKGAGARERLEFHKQATLRALGAATSHVDLIVWSETMMPPLNQQARATFRGSSFGGDSPEAVDLDQVYLDLRELASGSHAALLTGGAYADDFRRRPGGYYPADTRNSAYYFDRQGVPWSDRYDKVHLVPFGEYIPFQQSIPWLYRLLISLGPPDMADYQLHRGQSNHPVVFSLAKSGAAPVANGVGPETPWRFVTPICFEDIDGQLVAWMFRSGPEAGPAPSGAVAAPGAKGADFIVNITNDGWFRSNEMPQHFQEAIFRSIENRAPTARSVNTGISGFIDSLGQVDPLGLIPVGTEGTKVQTLSLDRRTTFYTRHGDVFALVCAAAAALMAAGGAVRWWSGGERRRPRPGQPGHKAREPGPRPREAGGPRNPNGRG